MNWKEEGPIGPISLEFDSLQRITERVTFATIGPRDPPSPFNLGNFIDTLATYPSRASNLGWIDSSAVADQLQISLDELSDDLAAGDSAHAAGLIERTLGFVESQKDSTLSSEAYGLFRYNLEYARDYLPEVFTLRLFAEGGYQTSTGQMETTINPVIPLADTVFNDPDNWNYETGKVFADIPAHTAEWVYVTLQETITGSKVYESTGLLDKYGYVSLPVDTTVTDSLYVMADHRNHLAIASDTLVEFTNGYGEHDFTSGHAYADGPNPQAKFTSGQDTVYAMWTADGDADGQITAPDFNLWLIETKAVETGYIESDYNMDTQSTASDFNLWLVRTKKVLTAPGFVNQVLYNKADDAPWTGSGSEAASKTSAGETIAARYRVTGNPYWASGGYVNVPIALKTNTGELHTLGSATFDVYFNSDQIYYDHPQQYQDLVDAGYTLEINEGTNEHGSFVRVDILTANPDTVSYQIDDQYPEKLLRLRFYENNGQITDHGVAMNRGTLDVVLLSGGVFKEPDETIPVFKDAYPY